MDLSTILTLIALERVIQQSTQRDKSLQSSSALFALGMTKKLYIPLGKKSKICSWLYILNTYCGISWLRFKCHSKNPWYTVKIRAKWKLPSHRRTPVVRETQRLDYTTLGTIDKKLIPNGENQVDLFTKLLLWGLFKRLTRTWLVRE